MSDVPTREVLADLRGKFERRWDDITGLDSVDNERELFRHAFALLAEVERLTAFECHHGWRGDPITDLVRTPCPACGGQLFVGQGGHLTCAVLSCKQPDTEDVYKTLRERAQAAEGRVEELEAWNEPVRAALEAADPRCLDMEDPDDAVKLIGWNYDDAKPAIAARDEELPEESADAE